jgi:spore maturation protein SpmB
VAAGALGIFADVVDQLGQDSLAQRLAVEATPANRET